MAETLFTSFDRTFPLRRKIGSYQGVKTGPVALFFAGIHGNEPSGIIALQKVFASLEEHKPEFKGTIIGVMGNLSALEEKKRFIDEDLNRNWDLYLESRNNQEPPAETKERNEISDCLHEILRSHKEEVYVIDLHSTSSESVPFVSIHDTMRNRWLVGSIPTPIILGLEEKMDGTLLSVLNDLGISSILFEAGQHDKWSSVENHYAFVWLMLERLGCLRGSDIPGFSKFVQVLAKESVYHRSVYEVVYKEVIDPKDNFIMKSGYVNFQMITQGEPVGHNVKGPIHSPKSGRIFMPLYQEQGEDGFFIVQEINPTWLRISRFFRNLKLDRALGLLAGVKVHPDRKGTYVINPKVALNALKFFHLFGYRKEKTNNGMLEVTRWKYDKVYPPTLEVLKNFERVFKRNGIARTEKGA